MPNTTDFVPDVTRTPRLPLTGGGSSSRGIAGGARGQTNPSGSKPKNISAGTGPKNKQVAARGATDAFKGATVKLARLPRVGAFLDGLGHSVLDDVERENRKTTTNEHRPKFPNTPKTLT